MSQQKIGTDLFFGWVSLNCDVSPNSQYLRKACFLWEHFTGQTIHRAIESIKQAYVPLFSPKHYITGRGKKNSRWRVTFNGLGLLYHRPAHGIASEGPSSTAPWPGRTSMKAGIPTPSKTRLPRKTRPPGSLTCSNRPTAHASWMKITWWTCKMPSSATCSPRPYPSEPSRTTSATACGGHSALPTCHRPPSCHGH